MTTAIDQRREAQARGVQARRAANGLDERDARIVAMADAGHTPTEIGKEVGLTPQGVKKVLDKNKPVAVEPEPDTGDQQQYRMMAVALDRIDPNPWQPRTRSMDAEFIAELAEDIHKLGLHQEPMARPVGVRFQLAFGHSRIDAIRLLHDTDRWGPSVMLKVAEKTDDEMAYIALSENRARKNLTPMEEISAWAKAVREIEGVTIQSLADKVGIDRGAMSRYIALLDLPSSVLELVDSGAMSLRAAREFLVLRNEDHCHEDAIALALKDLSSGDRYSGNPPDYRIKTVRKAIRGIATGRHAYSWVNGLEEESRKWRPLEQSGHHGRSISFDVEAFKQAFPLCIHSLPDGDESGGKLWTCNAREWGRWSSQATRAATAAAKESGSAPTESKPKAGRGNPDAEWWANVKKDPMVQKVVGSRLRAMKSPDDLTAEDCEALGSRVDQPNMNNVISLPQQAQPDGVKLENDYAPRPPMFDFSLCATCTTGAAWALPSYTSTRRQLVCTNRQAWMDKQSVGMQQWVEWKTVQVERDATLDVMAIARLIQIEGFDAIGLLQSIWGFVEQGAPVAPISRDSGVGWDERTRHYYYPAGAETFAQLTGLTLPNLHGGNDMIRQTQWSKAVNAWANGVVGDVNWSAVLAAALVWQARVNLGLGADIWGAVPVGTEEEEGQA